VVDIPTQVNEPHPQGLAHGKYQGGLTLQKREGGREGGKGEERRHKEDQAGRQA